MPFIPVITQREDPRAAPPETRASPDAFGANIGRAVQGFGSVVSQVGASFAGIGEKEDAEARQLRVAEAYANSDFTPIELDAFNNAPLGGQGYAEGISNKHSEWIDQQVASYSEKYPEDTKGANDLRLKLLSQRQSILSNASKDEFEMAAQGSTLASKDGLSVQLNSIRVDPTKYEQSLNAGLELIAAQPGFGELAKANGAKAFRSQAAVAYFEAQLTAAEQNPNPLDAMLAIQKELAGEKWQSEFTAEHYETTLNAVSNNLTSAKNALRSIVTSRLSDYTERSNAYSGDPADLMDLAELNGFYNDVAKYAPDKAVDLQRVIDQQTIYHQSMGMSIEDQRQLRDASSVGTGTLSQLQTRKQVSLPSGVTVVANIQDRTGLTGMTPRAMSILESAANAGAAVGIVRIEVTAGKGEGHKSHSAGTEWDIKGYTADGKLWTPEQRVAIAAGGARAGADRFGLYSFGANYTGNGSLHIGYSDRAHGRPAAVWGYRGLTGGDDSRRFTNAAERQFLTNRSAGNPGRMVDGAPGNWLHASREAIAAIESRGQPEPYRTVNSASGALGRYQVMPANLPEWSKAALGKVLTPEQFLADPDAQDRIFNHVFGGYVKKYGNLQDAASAWFTGRPITRSSARGRDAHGTTGASYVDKFNAELGIIQQGGGVPPTNAGGPMGMREWNQHRAWSKVVEKNEQAISANMMEFATNNPVPTTNGIAALDLSVPEPSQFAQRGQDMMAVAQYHNVAPEQWKAFTPSEENVLKSIMSEGNEAQQLALLKAVSAMPQTARDVALKQLGQTDGVFAMAGRAAGDGRTDVALGLIQGRKRLTTKDGVPVPWLKNTDEAFSEVAGDAFAGFDPETLGPIKAAADAMYANTVAMVPGGNADENVDSDRYAAALAQLMGFEIDDVNGVTTFLPPGVDGGTVSDFMESATLADWIEISENGQPPVDRQLRPVEPWAMSGARLFMVDSEANYKVATDTGWVMTESGQPFIVHIDPNDFNALAEKVVREADASVRELQADAVPGIGGTVTNVRPKGPVPWIPGLGFVVDPQAEANEAAFQGLVDEYAARIQDTDLPDETKKRLIEEFGVSIRKPRKTGGRF